MALCNLYGFRSCEWLYVICMALGHLYDIRSCVALGHLYGFSTLV